jgi:putative acetyltransferase
MYGDLGLSRFRQEDFVGDGIAFLTAYRGEDAVGCGAVRPFNAETPKIGEIKRMFVEPAARGLGISRQILARLEEVGRDLGYETLRLETGIKQPAALHLYETSGYKRIECYDAYRNDPHSICFEKSIIAKM